jgi:hypothetical protein
MPIRTELPGFGQHDWTNGFKRWCIPGYASAQDKKISEYFTKQLKDVVYSESSLDLDKIKSDLSLAEEHISSRRGWWNWQPSGKEIGRLEHYTLAVRERLNLFTPSRSRQELFQKCRFDNQPLLAHWLKCGFSEETFWAHPDLVDFIFKTHLHRHIRHPYYNHTIGMQWWLTRRGGEVTPVKEPHLLFNGRQMPWTEIRKKMHVDSQSRLYTKENGRKKRWSYLENGFTELKEDHFTSPQPLRKLAQAPPHSQIEIVTTHAHTKDWNITDRVLQGNRHSFFRIVPGVGFSARHPEVGMEQGAVYSFGWGTIWRDFNFFSPLSTLKGRWYSPDGWEFCKQDQCVTTLDVTDDKITRLMEIIRRRSQEELPFHFLTANCSGITAEVLNEAGVIDLDTKNHMAKLSYEFFLPESVRKPLDKIFSFFIRMTPQCICNGIQRIGAFFYSIVFAPIFSVLGAWRTKISFENEEGESLQQNMMNPRIANRVKALYSNVYDLFRPSKMEFDMTKNIYTWQLRQHGTTYEKRD